MLSNTLKTQILQMAKDGWSHHNIARELSVSYNQVQWIAKGQVSHTWTRHDTNLQAKRRVAAGKVQEHLDRGFTFFEIWTVLGKDVGTGYRNFKGLYHAYREYRKRSKW